VQVAEQGGFPSAEAVVSDRDRNRHLHPHHARLHVVLESASHAAVTLGKIDKKTLRLRLRESFSNEE
jgi:hypothetical protein